MKHFLALLLLFSAATAEAKTKLSVGGILVDSDDVTVIVSGEHSYEKDRWQWIADGEYTYKSRDGETYLNRGFIGGKANYALDSRQYTFADTRYDYNSTRSAPEKIIGAVGYGYKLIRTSKTKMSNEVSVGVVKDLTGYDPIVRNSLWVQHKFAEKTTFLNKFLVEYGKTTFIRNQTELNYAITKNLTFGLKNTYVKDPLSKNIASFNLGVNF